MSSAVSDLSLEHRVALMSPEERAEFLADVDLEELEYDWHYNGRPSQMLPILPEDGDINWSVALALAGRGFGKTLMGAQWIRETDASWRAMGEDTAHLRVALLGRTSADVRDTMLEGPSGLLSVYPPSVRDRVIWTPSRRRVELPNGGVVLCFSAEEPAQLRGPGFHRAWCLAEGTRIRTAGGELPIEQIEAGDRVWTRDGLRPVLAAGFTGVKQLITLRTSDGRELRGSGDHRIWTQHGWTFMRDVVPSDIVYAWTTRLQDPQRFLSGTASSGTETPRMATTATPVGARSCTSPSGSPQMAESPTGLRFITETTTEATISSTTLLRDQSRTTAPTMPKNGSSMTRPGPSRFSPKPPEHARTPSGRIASPTPWSAETAASVSSPSACEPSTARLGALQPLAVVAVEKTWGWTRTYDLAVAGTSEYFAEGLLVHNCDELATYKQVRTPDDDATAWENLRIAVRLGKHPQILATTTPKRVPVLRQILAQAAREPEKYLLRRGRTYDNKYLSAGYLDVLTSLYGGTGLGRQELEGEMLDDVAGAMTSEAIIERNRVTHLPPNIPWIKLISIDPSVAERPNDECGIMVIYISRTWPVLHRHAFVVDDLSLRAAPNVWADVAIRAAHEHQATIIAETNQGANLVFQMLRQAADHAHLEMPPMKEVWSTKAKAVRAEPVGGAYAINRIHHVNVLAEYESQATTWTTNDGYSPDRMDAAVQGIASGLFPEALTQAGGMGPVNILNAARTHIPISRYAARDRRISSRGLYG